MFHFFKRKKQPIVDQFMDAKRQVVEKKNEIADKILSRGFTIERRIRQLPVEFERRKTA